MSNRLRYAQFHENLFIGNEIRIFLLSTFSQMTYIHWPSQYTCSQIHSMLLRNEMHHRGHTKPTECILDDKT